MEKWREQATLSVDEAAKILGVSRSLGFTMVKDGSLPALRLGQKRLRIVTAALIKMLDKASGE